jgi:hypothetical protein
MNDSTDRVKLIFNAVLGTKHYISAESIILYHNGSGKNALVELHERIAKCIEEGPAGASICWAGFQSGNKP